MKTECVYCALRSETLNLFQVIFRIFVVKFNIEINEFLISNEICLIQGGSNMTGTDLYVKKSRTAQQLCDLERVKPQPPPSLLLGFEPLQSCLGVARVMSEQKVPRSVEQRIVIKFLV